MYTQQLTPEFKLSYHAEMFAIYARRVMYKDWRNKQEEAVVIQRFHHHRNGVQQTQPDAVSDPTKLLTKERLSPLPLA